VRKHWERNGDDNQPEQESSPAELLLESVMGFGFGILRTGGRIGTSVGAYAVGALWGATGDYCGISPPWPFFRLRV